MVYASSEDLRDKDAPLCKCGCGKKVRWSRSRGHYSEYVNGHNSKGKTSIDSPSLFKKGLPKWK